MSSEISHFVTGLAQMDARVVDCDFNARRAGERIASAARSDAQVAVLCEPCLTGYALDRVTELASGPDSGGATLARSLALACNRVGGDAITFFSRSVIIDPWSGVVTERDESESVVLERLQRARLSQIRTKFAFLADKRAFDAEASYIAGPVAAE